MNTISRILVPVDFSPGSSRAIDYALTLADKFQAKIDLVHVWEPPVIAAPETAVLYAGGLQQSLAEITEADAVDKMKALIRSLKGRAVAVDGEVLMGRAATEIVRLLEKGRQDLVVMGTHGRTGLSRVFLGSVAENVIRHAPCPVLTVRTASKAAETQPVWAVATAR